MTLHPKCAEDPGVNWGYSYDVALAAVREEFTFNKELQPVPMYRAELKEAQTFVKRLISKAVVCHVSGFGATALKPGSDDEYGYLSKELKAIELNIIDEKKCLQLLNEFDNESYIHLSLSKKHNLCAVSPTKGDACVGDSGAGLICEGKLVGLLSWGPICGEGPGPVPSMYVEVYRFHDFLDQLRSLSTDAFVPLKQQWTSTTVWTSAGSSALRVKVCLITLIQNMFYAY